MSRIDIDLSILNDPVKAAERKQQLLEMINAYNVALFNDEELPYTDEEIEYYQEEYQILNDHLDLSNEEILEKLDDSQKETLEDGTVIKKVNKIDSVHWPIFFYWFILVLLTCGLFTTNIATQSCSEYINNIFNTAYNVGVAYDSFTESSYALNGTYWFSIIFKTIWLPVLGILIALIPAILYGIFDKSENKINAKLSKWIFIAICVIAVVSTCIIFFKDIYPTYSEIYLNQNDQYNSYYCLRYLQELSQSYGY